MNVILTPWQIYISEITTVIKCGNIALFVCQTTLFVVGAAARVQFPVRTQIIYIFIYLAFLYCKILIYMKMSI